MIKICSPQLGLNPNSVLGGEVHDAFLIEELCKENVKIDVLLPKNKIYKKHRNLKVKFLPIGHIFPPHLFNLLALPFVFEKCREGTNILRLHNPYFLGFLGLIAKKRFPYLKVVTTIHLKEERWDLVFIIRKTIHIYDHIFVVSDYLAKWVIEKFGFPEERITVIYNGVDPLLKPIKKDAVLVRKFALNS